MSLNSMIHDGEPRVPFSSYSVDGGYKFVIYSDSSHYEMSSWS